VCEYTYRGGKWLHLGHSAPCLTPGGICGIPGRHGVRSGVGCLCQSGGGAPVPLRLQRVCRFFAVPFGQGRHPFVWF